MATAASAAGFAAEALPAWWEADTGGTASAAAKAKDRATRRMKLSKAAG